MDIETLRTVTLGAGSFEEVPLIKWVHRAELCGIVQSPGYPTHSPEQLGCPRSCHVLNGVTGSPQSTGAGTNL